MTTALHQNPFNLLEVTTRDNRRRIFEQAEDRSLWLDSEVCDRAKADLINPRNRLPVEMAWLPGLSPSRATNLLGGLTSDYEAAKALANVPPLARANLIAATIEQLDESEPRKTWLGWITQLAASVEEIDVDLVLRAINEDRAVSGFAEVGSIEVVTNELVVRRRAYKDAVRASINRLPTAELISVITELVEHATVNGSTHAPLLVDEIIDAYELETQTFLEQEAENVEKLIGAAREAIPKGEGVVSMVLDKLEEVVRQWDRVAQPIQLSAMSRGVDHDSSRALAIAIRGLGLHLYNEHGLLESTQRITDLLQEVFAELPTFAEKLDEDSTTLKELAESKVRSQQEAAEWNQSITFRTELGAVFKDILAISPAGVQWKNLKFPLDSITRVRWGATKHSVNGVPTGTTYTLYFGDDRNLAKVETRNEKVFDEFQSKLWIAVVSRMLKSMVRGLKAGNKYRFGDLVMDDLGAEITKHKFFGTDERVYAKWSELKIWSANGAFHVGLGDIKSTNSELSYLETDNAHLVEFLIRKKYKAVGTRISAAFE